MTAFTDDDLKRLKEDVERDTRIGLKSAKRFVALLARLEAAEAYGNAMAGLFRDPEKIKTLWDAWRKSCGR